MPGNSQSVKQFWDTRYPRVECPLTTIWLFSVMTITCHGPLTETPNIPCILHIRTKITGIHLNDNFSPQQKLEETVKTEPGGFIASFA